MRELFLTSFGGIHYGIWKDEILSVRDLPALHRIPLSPARIAGILIDDGRTVTLIDLPVCLGYESSPGIGQGSILLMEEGEKVTGFVVSGEIRTQSFSPELLFPLPDYLKSPVFDTCAIHDGIPIPIINIAELYSRVLKADEVPSVDLLRIPAAQPQDISGTARIRFFDAGGELFAVSAAGIDDKAVKPGPVTPLPNTPQYVKGVTFRDGRLLPVIDLSQRIKRQSVAPELLMLIAGIADAAFGLLIDGDAGTLSADEVTIKPVPLIAQTSWLKDVVVRAGEPIPLIDLAMALSPDPGAGDEKPIWQRYAPGSGFPALFARHDVNVVEFSLMGERHALPKEEVEDVIAYKPCRKLPDVPPIVIGVAEHDGEILPVVDLAMMFGRQSLSTSGWRMMLVKNGTFRALVITEAVFGERRLQLDIQRAVPIHLPHHLMYGCYPDAEAVRLILNVQAISVHFEKSLIKKFLPALSHEMKNSPTEIVHALMDEKAGERPHHLSTVAPAATVIPEIMAQPRAEPAPAVASADALPPAGHEDLAVHEQASWHQVANEQAPELQQQAEEENVELIEVQEVVTAAPAIAPEPETETEQIDVVLAASPSASTQESLPAAEEMSANETLEQGHVPPSEAVSEKMIEPETISAAAELPELAAPLHSVLIQEPSGAPYHIYQEVEQPAVPSGHEERPANRAWKRRIVYGFIVTALVAVFYFLGTSHKPVVEKSVKETEPARIEQGKAQTEQSKAKTEPPRPAEKPRTPLVLEIPANMPVDIDVYVVKEGDTLWSISNRFTGNPFNYPRIAGENRIPDPDLIFPGQRIRLIK